MKFDFKLISMAGFCAFAIKLLILPDISAFQALSLLISAVFVAFYEYKASLVQLAGQQKQIDALTEELVGIKRIQVDIITNISTVKTAINMKSQNTRNY